MNQFCPVTMIARTIPGTHNPRISAQTMTHRLREIGERPPYTSMFYMRRFSIGLVYNNLRYTCKDKAYIAMVYTTYKYFNEIQDI